VDALVADLEAWQQHRPVRARAGGVFYRSRRWIERNRALASALLLGSLALVGGSGVALWQADRARDSALAARAAQASAEQFAARADAVNRFLLDLFRARIPNLPPDQLPTTEQLMDRGIERARDPASGPPALRAELLTSLAEILAARSRMEDADALLGEAEALVAEDPSTYDALRLRLAVARAELARNRNQIDQAERYLHSAIALYRELRPDDPMVLSLQRDLARILMRREQFELAEQAARALQQERSQWPDTDEIALRVAGDLAVIAASTGRQELASERFEHILEMKLALGHEPLSLATTEVNLGNLARIQFRYDEAIERYGAVLERLAPYTEVPRSVRATAWTGLAHIARVRGDFSAAADWLNRAAEEWARVLDLPSIEDDFFIHYYGARLDADRGDYRAALARLETAIQRLSAVEEGPEHRIGVLMADRARTLCQLGELAAAEQALADVSDWPGEPVRRAELEARAVCALAGGAADPDPELISAAHIEHALRHSGDICEIARLELLRAELLIAAGRSAQAEALLASATVRLDAGGVRADHPLRARIRALDGR
jgi:tetratricopeptide (TPR) repeat protein